MKNLLLVLFFITTSGIYAQQSAAETPSKGTKAYDQQVEKTKTQWKYNPFRKSAKEMLLFGWQNPYSFISRFWIGGIVDLKQMFPTPAYGMENAWIAFTPALATEINVIPFRVGDRLKINIGIGFLAELYFLVFKLPTSQRHGNVHLQSDVLNVSVFIDFIVDDTWRIRLIPIAHHCSHGGGDYYGDPSLGGNTRIVDYGYEGGTAELYYNWKFITAYGGLRFAISQHYRGEYATLFALFTGVDFRVPIWGAINFIAGIYVAAEYNTFNTLDHRAVNDIRLISSYKSWDPLVSLGVGIEIDRISFAFRYKNQRSRSVVSYEKIDQRYGFETTIYF